MNLRNIDLKLLVVFDAVMRERNVTRAATVLGLSQPAVSGALNRLRHIIKDKLFTRVAGGVRPTAKAAELAAPIHNALMQLETALGPDDFSPAATEAVFTMAASVHAAGIVMPGLARVFETEAPRARFRVYAKNDQLLFDQLDSGEVDFGLGVIQDPPGTVRHQTLMRDTYVCMMRCQHPLARRQMSPEDYFRARHVGISQGGEADHYLDKLLSGHGLARQYAVTLGQSILVSQVLQHSDLLYTTFRQMVPRMPDVENLHVIPLPFAVEPVEIRLAWNELVDDHAPHLWLRHHIVQIFEQQIGSNRLRSTPSRPIGRRAS